MIFPLGTACSSVMEQGGGGMKFFCLTRSVTASREALGNFAKKFIARAVENGDGFAAFHPQDMQRMVRLASLRAGGRCPCSCSGGR